MNKIIGNHSGLIQTYYICITFYTYANIPAYVLKLYILFMYHLKIASFFQAYIHFWYIYFWYFEFVFQRKKTYSGVEAPALYPSWLGHL